MPVDGNNGVSQIVMQMMQLKMCLSECAPVCYLCAENISKANRKSHSFTPTAMFSARYLESGGFPDALCRAVITDSNELNLGVGSCESVDTSQTDDTSQANYMYNHKAF